MFDAITLLQIDLPTNRTRACVFECVRTPECIFMCDLSVNITISVIYSFKKNSLNYWTLSKQTNTTKKNDDDDNDDRGGRNDNNICISKSNQNFVFFGFQKKGAQFDAMDRCYN